MSPEFWAIVVAGIAIFWVNYVAADENEKRLNRIVERLDRLNETLRPKDPDWD